MSIHRVHHLNCASIGGLSLLGQHLVCHILLLETSSGLVLVDTGLGTSDYARISSRLGVTFAYGYGRPRVDPSLAAIHQIRRLGFDPRDVRHIVQTHLDLDHVGGLSDFPEATVHVHELELEAALRRRGPKARGRYRPRMWAHGPRWSTYGGSGEPWLGFDAVRALPGLPEEIFAIPLFGHTHGHVGIVVQAPDATLLHAGDAYFDSREVKQPERECGRGVGIFQWVVTTEYDARRRNQDRLRALHADHPEVRLFCAHNPAEYRAFAEGSGDAVHGYYATRPDRGLTVA